jgi:hypothetical protein
MQRKIDTVEYEWKTNVGFSIMQDIRFSRRRHLAVDTSSSQVSNRDDQCMMGGKAANIYTKNF